MLLGYKMEPTTPISMKDLGDHVSTNRLSNGINSGLKPLIEVVTGLGSLLLGKQ